MSTTAVPAEQPIGARVQADDAPSHRIRSIDIIRGAVMVLMALDHVRLFLTNAQFDPMDLSQTTTAYFFTRWITHLCAPAFVFLAGTGAYLHGRRMGSARALSGYLFTRGVWLLFIEMTLVRFGWTFNLDYSYTMAGVIWVIGWSMIVLAGLVRLPLAAVLTFGLTIVAGHNLLSPHMQTIGQALQDSGWFWLARILYFGGPVRFGESDAAMVVLYSLIPWVGVIACGYAFGAVMRKPAEERRRICFTAGTVMIALFALLRGFNLYGNPRPWQPQDSAWFSFLAVLNTAKYPASLSYLLMTLGPTLLLIPLLERARGVAADVLTVFGRVPFFYYILHLPLIHLVAVLLSVTRYDHAVPWLFGNHPMAPGQPPEGWGYNLLIVWLITAAVVALLYFPCRWFAALKARRSDRWLSYL